jgi:hypothetical protein
MLVADDISSRSGEGWHEPGAHGITNRDQKAFSGCGCASSSGCAIVFPDRN